ncbi:MAG TPA: hypothetical protein VMW58_00155 [Anaerolineae bacterium]|nr:hypothetical protein [Anaerolineae bacterium]
MEHAKSISRATPLKGWLDELLVVILVFVALLLGWAVKGWVEGQTVSFTSDDGAISLRYPARWLEQVDKSALLTVRDVRREGAFKPTFSLSTRGMNPDFPLTHNDLLVTLSIARGDELTAFRVLSLDPGTVGGKEASTMTYAYVAEAAGGSQAAVPVVVQAADSVAIHEGRAYIFTFAALAEHFEREQETFRSMLAGVDFN